jgi:hypothetical protein
MATADEEDRKHRAAREYLARSPLLDVMVRAALRSAGHYPPEIQQRMEASRPWLAERFDPIVVNLLVKHFTTEEIESATRWATTPLGRSFHKKHAGFSEDLSAAVQPILQRLAQEDIRGEER